MPQQPRTVPKLTQSQYDDINRRMDSVDSIFNSFRLPDPLCDDPCFDPNFTPTEPQDRLPVGCCDEPWGELPDFGGEPVVDVDSIIMTDVHGDVISPAEF